MLNSPSLLVIDYLGPVVSAALFVLVMSLVKEPARRTFNAIFAAGAVWRVSEWWIRPVGIALSGDRDSGRISRSSVIPFHRDCLAHAFLLGHRSPPVGQPDLAFHAHVFVWMHDLRCFHRGVVFIRRALGIYATNEVTNTGSTEIG